MTDKTLKVLNGFLGLTAIERMDFLNEVASYNNLYPTQKQLFEEKIKESLSQRSSVGPKDSICTCCGR